MRTLIDLPDDDIRALTEIAKAEGVPRAALIRRAVADWLAAHGRKPEDDAFGLWTGEEDGLAYQQRLRVDWQRPSSTPTSSAGWVRNSPRMS
jgi:predicted transcriptional regulator